MDRDVRTFLLLAVGKIFVAVAALVLALLLGQALGPAAFGQWTLIIGAATMLHTALINWTHGLTVRFGRAEWAASGTLGASLSARAPLLAASLAAAALLLALQPFDWLSRGFGAGAAAPALVAIYAASLWITAEAQATLQATGRLNRQAALAPIVAAGAIAAILVLGGAGALSVPAAVVGVASTSLVVWGASWVASLREARVRLTAPPAAEIRRHARYAAPLWGAFVIGYLSDWGDHLLLARFMSIDVVGQFALAYQVFAFSLAAPGVIATVVLPRLIAVDTHARDAANRYVRQVIPVLFVFWVIAASFGVALLPAMITSVAGESFTAAAGILIVLCAVVPTAIVTSLYGVLFSLQERTMRQLAYGAVMTAVNLGLSLMLIPRMGAAGAALGTVASYIVAQALYMRDQHQYAVAPGLVSIWITMLAFGAAQTALLTLPARLAWAVVASAATVWIARRTSAVDGPMLDRVLSGLWAPLRTGLHRLLVSPVGGVR